MPRFEDSELRALAALARTQGRFVLKNEDDALDVAQATMACLLVWGRRPDNPEAWVTTVSRRIALTIVRQRKREQDKVERCAHLGRTEEPDFASRVAAAIVVEQLLRELPPRQRQALELRFGQDLAQMTVAELMECSEQTVKTHVKRARRAARIRADRAQQDEGER